MDLILLEYGSFALFFLLMLGIIALPIPEESLMILSGVLMSNQQLPILPTVLAAYAGSMCGITGSYIIGRTVGTYCLHRFGGWAGIDKAKIDRAHEWFEKYGKWTLVVGYFIPGVRHLTGILAGASYLEYRHFALFAYVGAFLWASLFMSFGYYFGDYGVALFGLLEGQTDLVIIAGILIALSIIAERVHKHHRRKKQ